MLFHLLYPLHETFGALNIFRYISFRAAMAAITAFAICMFCGPPLIRCLRRQNILEEEGKTDSNVLKQICLTKPSTPTMGGCIILLGILGSSLLWGRLDNRFIILGILGTLAFAIIGFIDDYIKLVYFERKGLRSFSKFFLQVAVSLSLTFAVFVLLKRSGQPELMRIYFPIGREIFLDLGFWGGTGLFVIALFLIVGTSNAVNLTDGLDGLAAGCMLITSGAMAVICYVGGRADFSQYLHIPHVEGSGELTIFCAAMTGATMGFLWYNCHPANVYMGDTGSLSLGGLLGFIAVACKQEVLLLIVGGVFFVEAISVILQVGSYRLRGGRRIFLCAPIHHHFQFKNWKDPQITVRFWIVAAILAILGLSTLKMH